MLDRLLNRPVSVTMILLVFVVLGCIGIGSLPVSLMPDVDIPFVTVQVSAPGMSARELDDAVVRPLRLNLLQVDHLKDIKTESKDGNASLTLDFEEGQNVDFSFIEVNEKIDRSMSTLPKIDRPKVFKASAADIPAFFINVTLKEAGKSQFLDMSDFVEDVITKRIEQLDEVAMVDVSGFTQRQILVIPDKSALTKLNLSLDDFESSIASANVSLSRLTIRDGEYHYNVKFRSFASSAEDIANVYFKAGERLLQVRDVARVTEQPAPDTGVDLSNGERAIVLAVIKQSEARMSDLRKSVSKQLELFSQDYPDLKFELTRDQTELLEYSIRNLLLNIVLAILLDCVIIFLFMKDFRSPFLVSLTIPLSLVMSFFVFYLLGMSINIISLSGLMLGVGMMVDNTIVLTDNITAHWQRGEKLRKAVIDGTQEVAGAMLSSVLTTCAVFVPLVFLNGLAGDLFFDQAVTITVVLLVSYLVTVIVLPVYYWTFYKKLDSFKPNEFLSKFQFDKSQRLYDSLINWFLSNKWTAWAMPLAALGLIAVCALYVPKEKLPYITYTDTVLEIDWNDHISLEENLRRVGELDDILGETALQTTSMVGIQQFLLNHSVDQSLNQTSVYFKCTDEKTLVQTQERIKLYLREKYPSSLFQFGNSGNIFDMIFSQKEAPLLVRIRPSGDGGLDVDRLKSLLGKLRERDPELDVEDIPLKRDVLYLSDPEKMSLYEVRLADLEKTLKNALNGNELFDIVQGNRSVPVVMGTDLRGLEEIMSSAKVKAGENELPVNVVMRQNFEEDFKSLVSGKEGGYYPLSLEIPASKIEKTMTGIRETIQKDGNFDVGFSGSYFSNIEMIRQMALILAIALVLLFLILASQFESLIQPFIILSEVVIDIAVSILALWIIGSSINIMSLIGLVVICGIVINDSILKIDTINKLVKGGMEIEPAIHEAGHRRLKAIIMTSLTTVLSVAPFLSRGDMGSDLQYPMAVVIVVGMIVGTLVSLFYVPAVYAAIYRRK